MERLGPKILRELSVSECFTLLATSTIGRLAITQNALPALVPVRIQLAGDEVHVTSLIGDMVPLVARGVVALGTGNLGEGLPTEWSVEVCGFLRAQAGGLELRGSQESSADTFSLSTTKIRGWTTASEPIPEAFNATWQGQSA